MKFRHGWVVVECTHPDRKRYSRGACKKCYGAWRRGLVVTAEEKKRAAFLHSQTWHKSHFGFDSKSRARLLNEAGRKCEACGGTTRLCIDHDHTTHRVRGVLCDTCNRTLGLIELYPNALVGILAYLEESKTGPRRAVVAAGLADVKVPARRPRKRLALVAEARHLRQSDAPLDL